MNIWRCVTILRRTILPALTFGVAVCLSHAAYADDCVTITGPNGAPQQACPVIITSVVGHATSIDVHWLPGGGIPPQTVALVSDGTAGNGFRDGHELARSSQASAAGIYSSYQFTVQNLPQNTRIGALHLIGIWSGRTLASAQFAATTQAEDNYSPPTITSASFKNDQLTIFWTAPRNWQHYNLRYQYGKLDGGATQAEVHGGTESAFSFHQHGLGTYYFIVQGCDKHVFAKDSCSKWSGQATAVAVAEAAPKVNSYNFDHMSSGDCEMQNTVVTFRSNGTGTMTAQVKTNHSHTYDIWHTTISGQTATGQDLFDVQKFDSMKLREGHGWYPWTRDFTFDPTNFARLGKAHMRHSC